MAQISFRKVVISLVNKEFQRQQLKDILPPVKKKNPPCLTVSRETGSGGRLVAQIVAKKLKMKFYDKQFVELIAKSTKKRKEVIESLDEKSKTMVEGIVDSLKPAKDKLSEARYFEHLCQTILSLSQKGKAVILGRGGNFIVPAKRCLRVRIIAPLKTRIKNSAQFENKSKQQAREDIKKIHTARKEFVSRYFLKDISNANYYDLVINTKHLDLEQVVSIIIKAFKQKFPQAG